eukprot:GHVU01074467.1.p1 GENE.GHVU01074467.1~~GHVU01074467.1.p1  ORF type:complete len:134 (-),score=1.51 GHVU01074467.1:137-538(-)
MRSAFDNLDCQVYSFCPPVCPSGLKNKHQGRKGSALDKIYCPMCSFCPPACLSGLKHRHQGKIRSALDNLSLPKVSLLSSSVQQNPGRISIEVGSWSDRDECSSPSCPSFLQAEEKAFGEEGPSSRIWGLREV